MKIGVPSNNKNRTIEDYSNDFKLLKEAGFDSIDLQSFLHVTNNNLYELNADEFVDFLTNVKNEAKKNDLIIFQLHSYWEYPPVNDYTSEGIENQIVYYKKAIEGARILGCKYVVIHQRFPFGLDKEINANKEEEFFKINVEFLAKLEKYARENDVILCLENLPMDFKYCKVDGVLKIINTINSDYVKMCLDIGHAMTFEDNIYEDIIKINDKLMCLHVHDNRKGFDLHLFPYSGRVKWDDVIKGLRDINYKGVFNFETAPSDKLDYNTRLAGLKYLNLLGKEITK